MNASTILPLELDNVSFEARGKRLINNISHRFSSGHKTVILGPNGAGKSLLLRLCHGLLEPTEGSVRWQGTGNPTLHQAMVFQRPVMLRRTAAANIDYALSLRKLPEGERRQRTAEVLLRTGLANHALTPARVLSYGEQQKLALARAWALHPEVLFLDEPTASLDPAASHAIEQIIEAIHQAGTRIIMTTHDLSQAQRLADDILFIHHGRLLESRPAAKFFSAPENPQAKAFLRGDLLWQDQPEPKPNI